MRCAFFKLSRYKSCKDSDSSRNKSVSLHEHEKKPDISVLDKPDILQNTMRRYTVVPSNSLLSPKD